MSSARLASLKATHAEIKKAADDARYAAEVAKNAELVKARALISDVIALRRERYSIVEIARRYGNDYALDVMCNVEDGLVTDPDVLRRYVFFVQQFAEWKGLVDEPNATEEPFDPETLLPIIQDGWITLSPIPIPRMVPNPKYKPPKPKEEPIDPETLQPLIQDGWLTLTPIPIPRMVPNPKYKPPKTT